MIWIDWLAFGAPLAFIGGGFVLFVVALFGTSKKSLADLEEGKEQKRLMALGMTPSAASWKLMEQRLRHYR